MTLFCSVEGCHRPNHARGWCGVHYYRWYRSGKPWGIAGPPRGESYTHSRHEVTGDPCGGVMTLERWLSPGVPLYRYGRCRWPGEPIPQQEGTPTHV